MTILRVFILVTLLEANVPGALGAAPDAIRHDNFKGAFDLSYSTWDARPGLCQATGPGSRFWRPGSGCNSNGMDAYQTCLEWLLNAAMDLSAPGSQPNQWVAVNSTWSYSAGGCGAPVVGPTLMALDFADVAREGTLDHRGLYAVAGVSASCLAWDFDQVADAFGRDGNIVPVAAIPRPVVLGSGSSAQKRRVWVSER